MITLIADVIKQCWEEWFPQRPRPQFRFAKIAGNSLLSGRVVILAFASDNGEPALVIKLPRTNRFVKTIAQEYRGLQEIQTMWPQANTPRALWFGEIGFTKATIETAVVGYLMGNMRSPWLSGESRAVQENVRFHFELALGWLADFQTRTTAGYRQDIGCWQILDDAPAVYKDCAARLTSRLSSALMGHQWPLVAEHGDYWAGNLYIQADKRIGVIDWVDLQWAQMPLFDAGFFVASYALGFAPRTGNALWMFQKLFDPQHWFAATAQTAMKHYLQQLELPEIELQSVVGLALLRRVLAEHQRLIYNDTYSRMLDYWIKAVAYGG
jgi:hypothetical protein